MPKGVASNLLHIIQGDHRTGQQRTWVTLAVALVLFVPAWFMAGWWALAVHGVAALVSTFIGRQWSKHVHAKRYQTSLMNNWNRWMRYAVSCASVPEIHQKVTGRSTANRPFLYAAGLTILWVAELALFVLAFRDPITNAFDFPVIAANGALVGFILGYHWWAARWYRELDRSVTDLVEAGELGVWGVI